MPQASSSWALHSEQMVACCDMGAKLAQERVGFAAIHPRVREGAEQTYASVPP